MEPQTTRLSTFSDIRTETHDEYWTGTYLGYTIIGKGEYVNAGKLLTEITNGAKDYYDWARCDGPRAVIEVLTTKLGTPSVFKVERPLKYKGTFVYYRLLPHIMMWSSVEVGLMISDIVTERVMQDRLNAIRTECEIKLAVKDREFVDMQREKDDVISRLERMLQESDKKRDQQFQAIKSDTTKIISQNDELKHDKQELNDQLKTTIAQNNTLINQNTTLITQNDDLSTQNSTLIAQNDSLLSDYVEATTLNADLEIQQEQLKQTVTTTRNQVGELVDHIAVVMPRYVPFITEELNECVVIMHNPTVNILKIVARQNKTINQAVRELRNKGFTRELTRAHSPNGKNLRQRLHHALVNRYNCIQLTKVGVTEIRLGTLTMNTIAQVLSEIEQSRVNGQ